MFFENRVEIASLINEARIPAIYMETGFVAAGGLISYGPKFTELFHLAATYVDKILKGAKPGDLPIEQPTNFELVINLKVAKALGIDVPTSILLRADQVIE
jgi:putative ABC transport system substrate-binding protein